jgi:hypothetical protein
MQKALAVGRDSAIELNPDTFAAMQKTAKNTAAQWYESSREKFEKKINQQTAEYMRFWYDEKVQPEIQMQARVRIIRLNSKANSLKNTARNGLKYAKHNANKAIESAENGQRSAADAYMKGARKEALEGLEATSQLADIVQTMQKARLYMIPYVEHETKMKNVESMTGEQLKRAFDSLPQRGHFAALRNIISFLIDSIKMIHESEKMLAEAEEMIAQAKPVIIAAEKKIEQSFTAQAAAKAGSAARTFDVSSRQAFDLSMSELAKTLPPQGQVKFYQKWGALVQEAIGKDPTLMADESKYLAFIKKHFDGKTAAQVIEP